MIFDSPTWQFMKCWKCKSEPTEITDFNMFGNSILTTEIIFIYFPNEIYSNCSSFVLSSINWLFKFSISGYFYAYIKTGTEPSDYSNRGNYKKRAFSTSKWDEPFSFIKKIDKHALRREDVFLIAIKKTRSFLSDGCTWSNYWN